MQPRPSTVICLALMATALSACTGNTGSDAPAAADTTAIAPSPAPAGDPAIDDNTIAVDPALAQIIASPERTPGFVARDRYRNPGETLAFFGLKPDQTVIEITPGAGWYSEILAPYLRDGGRYVAAVVDPEALPEENRGYHARSLAGLEKKFADDPAHFAQARTVAYDPAAPRFGEPGSADLVLTFRNVHNWLGSGQAQGMFDGFFQVLRPGGVLGVVEHRARPGAPDDGSSGYVSQDQVVALAEAAGFRLQEASQINANPADTKDHPNGVWTLPPTNQHDEADAERYLAIGESDRMTLRFIKPE